MQKNRRISNSLVFISLTGIFLAYTAWVYKEGTGSSIPMNERARRGKLYWQKYNCTACHQLYGLGGYLGPDLTNVTERKGVEYVLRMMQSAKKQMPAFHMSPDEREDIAAFLQYVNETGRFPEKQVDFTWYGSFRILHHNSANK